MPGTPIILAFGHWMGGVPGLMLMPAILGALAVLTFGGAVARLVGARWSVPAALALAVSLPILYTSRAAFSETCSMILLFGAISLLLDARYRLRACLLGVGFLPATPAPLPDDDLGRASGVRWWLAREGSPVAALVRRAGAADSSSAAGRDGASTGEPGREPAGEKAGRPVIVGGGAGVMRALAVTRAVQAGDAAVVAALAGLIFGLALLVRVDALRDVLPVLGYAGVLIALHRYRGRRRGRSAGPVVSGGPGTPGRSGSSGGSADAGGSSTAGDAGGSGASGGSAAGPDSGDSRASAGAGGSGASAAADTSAGSGASASIAGSGSPGALAAADGSDDSGGLAAADGSGGPGASAVSGGLPNSGASRSGASRGTDAADSPDMPDMSDGRLGWPLLGGLLAGGGIGFLAAYLLARPYLIDLSDSLRPLLAICAAFAALTALGAALAPRLGWRVARLVRRPSARVARPLPLLAAGLVVAVPAGFAVRPWVQTVHRVSTTPEDMLTADFIEKTQIANGLAPAPTRLYYEESLYWVIWYVGVPVVVCATLAAAVLAHRLARGRGFGWLLPLAIIGWTTVTTLWRPGITPDHPFASRRLVPIIIPGLILLAAWGLRWARDRVRRAGHDRLRQNALLAAGALLLVIPGAVTSIGTAFTPVGRGEAAAVARLCDTLPRDPAVLIIERVTGDRLTQLVRGMCGVPAARLAVAPGTDLASPADVARLAARVRAAGRTPVLLAAEHRQLIPYGTPALALSLRTRQDERSLVTPPDGTWTLAVTVWTTVPP